MSTTDQYIEIPRSLRKKADSLPSQPLFTLDQVRSMISSSWAKREAELREEYGRILNDLLREQFDSFSSFNRDYISRQMRNQNEECSYLS